MLPQYERLDTTKVIFRIKFGIYCLGICTLPFFSFVFCVGYSLWSYFERATATHCNVRNYLPSISAAIGRLQRRFPFLGVHFTPRMDGSVWLGPNAVLAFKREGYNWSDINPIELLGTLTNRGFLRMASKYIGFGLGEMAKSAYIPLQVKELQKFIPDLTDFDVERGPSGVRAQALDDDGNLVDDFVFHFGEGDGCVAKQVLHCRNAPSPGATSSLAIAKMIADKIENEFLKTKK